MADLADELAQLPRRLPEIPGAELITCHQSMVQVRIRHTEHKQLTVLLQFPRDYPSSPLLVEIKSKTVPPRLVEGLVKICDQELRKHLGEQQVVTLLKFVSDFVASNPFLVCSEELNFIKKELCRDGDDLKVKQKAGVLHYKAYEGKYFIDFKLSVPNEYPDKPVGLEIKESNFPPHLAQVFVGHTTELSRQCVEPPLRKRPNDPPFVPKPSLKLIAEYLVTDCTRRYPHEQCSVCQEKALPEDPQTIINDESDPHYVYRVYCGHMYHRSCLDAYMKTPPFAGGKKCKVCGKRIAHDKWNVPPKLAEDRWAHQEARKREIAEVADFLGF